MFLKAIIQHQANLQGGKNGIFYNCISGLRYQLSQAKITRIIYDKTKAMLSNAVNEQPERGADHPPPSNLRGHKRVRLDRYSPFEPQRPVIGRTFTFT